MPRSENIIAQPQPVNEPLIEQQPLVHHLPKASPSVKMDTLTAEDLKAIMAEGVNVTSAASKKHWSLAAKIITGIFTLGIAPAVMCSKEGRMERQAAQDALRLKNALQRFASDPEAKIQVFYMSDKRVVVTKGENGALKASIDRQNVEAKYTAKDMIEIIEDDIVSHVGFYGKKAASELFGKVGDINITDARDVLDRTGGDSRHRDLCLKALKSLAGIDPSELHSCNTRYLDRMVRYALDGYYGSVSNLLDHVLTITKTNRVAAEDAKELLDAMEKHDKENPGSVEQKVNIRAIQPQKPQNTTQKQVQAMMADLIYAGNIADEDKYAGKTGERMQQVMEKNAKVINDIIITESGVNAVKAEQKAVAAEQKAAAEGASEADKAEAKALRAEANAAQYEALFIGNRVDLVPDSEKKEFWIPEIKAYKAEAKAIRLEAAKDPNAAEARAEANVLRAEVRHMRAKAAYDDVGIFAGDAEKAKAKAGMLETQAELNLVKRQQLELRGQALSKRHDALLASNPQPGSKEAGELAELRGKLEKISAGIMAGHKDLGKTMAELSQARTAVQIAEAQDRLEKAEETARKLEAESSTLGIRAKQPDASEEAKAAFRETSEKAAGARAEVGELKAQIAVLKAKSSAAGETAAMEKFQQAQAALEKERPGLRAVIEQTGRVKDDALKKKELLGAMLKGGLPQPAYDEEIRAADDAIAAAEKKMQEAQGRLDVLQKTVADAQKEIELVSPQGQLDAARQRAADAAARNDEAQKTLQTAKDDLARLEEEAKTSKLAVFKLNWAKMTFGKTESAAAEAQAAHAQAQAELAAIEKALAEPLAEEDIAFGKAGKNFDVDVPHRFRDFADLPEGQRKSFLDFQGFEGGADAIREPLDDLKDALIEQGQSPNETVIALGLSTEQAKAMINKNAAKLDNVINKMAQGLQDEMSAMILMLDATLKPLMQAGASAIKSVLEERGLPFSEENIDAVLAEEPRPQQIAEALGALAGSVTGVEGDANKMRLAEKMARSTLKDFIKLDQAAREAVQNADRAKDESKRSAEAYQESRTFYQIRLGEVNTTADKRESVRKEIKDTTEEYEQAKAAYADKKQVVEASLLVEDMRAKALKSDLDKARADYARTKAEVEEKLTSNDDWAAFKWLEQLEQSMAQKQVALRQAQEKLSALNIDLEYAKTRAGQQGGDPAQKQQALDAAQKAYDEGRKAVDDAAEALKQVKQEHDEELELAPDYVRESTNLRYAVTLAEAFHKTSYTQAQFDQLLQLEQDLAKKEVNLLYAGHDVTELGDELNKISHDADIARNHPRNLQVDRILNKEAELKAAYKEATEAMENAQKAFEKAKALRAQSLEQAPEFVRESAGQRYSTALAAARKEAAESRLSAAMEAFSAANARAVEAHKAEASALERKNAMTKKASVAENAAKAARHEANAMLGIVQAEAPEDAAENEEAGEAGQAGHPAQQPQAAANLSEQQKMIADLQAKNLETIAAEAAIDFKSDGYGKFIKTVLLNYFQSASMADKRSMFSAAMRYLPENADSNEMLGALLKGAGPILQKVLQGLDGPALPPALRVAFKDMKSNLAPIPEEVIQATLLDMVNRSNGKIANIEVVKSMGAASVGQALRCRITNSKGETRDCIIKILRPDAANRAAREREIFLRAAKQVNGMEGTFKGQYDKIMEELDFTIEYRNAKTGALYDKPFNGEKKIQSVKVVEDIPPSSSYMAMEIAPGDTLVGFNDQTRAKLQEYRLQFGASEKFDENGRRTKVTYTASASQKQDIIDAKRNMMRMYEDVKKRHDQMLALTEVWVKEGIFGAQGFFHGDLHGGNIMSDGSTLTAIDFGNATQLSSEQQSKVITMMIAAGTKQTTKFLEALRPLLTPETQRTFDEKYTDLREALRVVMRKGGDDETGTRIGAILSVLQKYGISIPPSLFNFSSSELRLQNSVAELAALMAEIKEDMLALGHARYLALESAGDMKHSINETMRYMSSEDATKTAIMNIIEQSKESIDWAMELLDTPGVTYDQMGKFTEAGLPQDYAEGGARARGREQLSKVIEEFNIYAMVPASAGAFFAEHIEPYPEAKAAWDANIDNVTNKDLPQAEQEKAKVPIFKALLKTMKDTFVQFESEMNEDPTWDSSTQSFFDVVSDVCRANRRASAWKIGVIPAIKLAVFDKL